MLLNMIDKHNLVFGGKIHSSHSIFWISHEFKHFPQRIFLKLFTSVLIYIMIMTISAKEQNSSSGFYHIFCPTSYQTKETILLWLSYLLFIVLLTAKQIHELTRLNAMQKTNQRHNQSTFQSNRGTCILMQESQLVKDNFCTKTVKFTPTHDSTNVQRTVSRIWNTEKTKGWV